MNNSDGLSESENLLDIAEEIKIVASCVERMPNLKNVWYRMEREKKNWEILLRIIFTSLPRKDTTDMLSSLVKRDIFEYCTKYNYSIQIWENDDLGKDSFQISCEDLMKRIRTNFGNCLSLYMDFIDVQIKPTVLWLLEKKFFRYTQFPLFVQISATYPNESYLLPEEEIEAAQKRCMQYIESVHNIAAKYVQRVEIITA